MLKLRCMLMATVVCLTGGLNGEDWNAFRGSDGTGVSSESHVPVSWSQEKNIAWKVELAGKGTSSPIVNGGRVFVTTQMENNDLQVMARSDGARKWGTDDCPPTNSTTWPPQHLLPMGNTFGCFLGRGIWFV